MMNDRKLARDASGGVVSTDVEALRAYRARRDAEKAREEAINRIVGDVAEIKIMLRELLKKNG